MKNEIRKIMRLEKIEERGKSIEKSCTPLKKVKKSQKNVDQDE